MGNFKKGLILGGVLGAFLTWFNVTSQGKEMRTKILMHLEPLYNELKASIKQLEGPTQEMWDALVERAVAEYSAKKELADEVKSSLIKQLKKKWEQLQSELKNS
ncbi:MAG: YtxH domain-containing protein [Candidatus Magasanikbacteria bacterium]